MSSDKGPEDELAGTEQPFVSHLVELRDRLIRASIAIGVTGLFSVILSVRGLWSLRRGRAGSPVLNKVSSAS